MDRVLEIRTADIVMIILFGTIALTAVSLLFIFIMLRLKRNRKAHHQEIDTLTVNFQQELLQTKLEIQEQTLKTISEEIHDNMGQVLSLAKLNLFTFEENSQQKLQDTRKLVSKAIADLRNLSRSMHSDIIAELGLRESVSNELTIIQNTRQFNTSLEVKGDPARLPKQKEMVLFRILQESLNNSIKYSGAQNINVILEYGRDSFSMDIEDDGKGFDPKIQTGIGLKSMQNRSKLIGGTFSLRSSPGNGTHIRIDIPNNNNN